MPRQLRVVRPDILLLQQEVQRLFERLSSIERPEQVREGEWIPSVDVYECGEKLTVIVEVPGLGPENLKVTHHDGHLVVSGERQERRASGVVGFLCMERPHGRFTRRIAIEVPVDVRQAKARLAGGLLTITLPRLKDRRGRETTIPVERYPGP